MMKAAFYRKHIHIYVSSCLSKLMEKNHYKKIILVSEFKHLLPTNQASFREGRSTLDVILSLEAIIQEGFHGSLNIHAISLDLSNAYDSTLH